MPILQNTQRRVPKPAPQNVRPTQTRVYSPTQLARLDNSRVDNQMPDAGPGYRGYYSSALRWGTEKTVETLKAIAARYHAKTGQILRIGDMSQKGGGDIAGHGSHEQGRNVDIDMAFSDGRSDIERIRNSVNATFRSAAYNRTATRILVQEIKRANPNIEVLFNDPVLIGEGLVREYPNHDNHLHLQRMT